MCQLPRTHFYVFCFLLIMPLSLFALQGDDQQIMHINSDASTFNYKTGTNIYEGHVKIDQGTTHLTADRVVTTNNDKHKIKEAIAYGLNQLAEYTTLPKAGDAELHAKAKVIKFYPATSLVFLEGDVVVTQGKNTFQGPVIIYNMKDQVVTAPPSKTGRSTIIIEPSQLTS
ncbi:MAG TPA: lipopolysaccharide transport periplasmic protein LptA [Gammaproteobacteria bacterium]|nr:lipopolysaccharide transport periplasmic protein LptA [Gammaproteobacteria bacterium]